MVSGPVMGISVYWSLAIEEQFYLVWPAVVLFCSRRRLIYVCGALVVAALASRLIMLVAGANPLLVYVSTLSRMDALAVGAAIAALRWQHNEWTRVTRAARWILPVASACLALLWLSRGEFSEYDPLVQTAGFTLLALLFGSVIVKAVTTPSGSRLHAMLDSRTLRFFGKYSYAMYLLHLAVKQFMPFERALLLSGGWPLGAQIVTFVTATSATAALAWLSWHLWEKHFLAMKRFFAAAPVPAPAVDSEKSAFVQTFRPGGERPFEERPFRPRVKMADD